MLLALRAGLLNVGIREALSAIGIEQTSERWISTRWGLSMILMSPALVGEYKVAMQKQENLWDFALRLYGTPGVSEACLLLQDESSVDVPVFLFALWLEGNSVALSHAELQRIDGWVKEWRERVVIPLRTIRRQLKTGQFPVPSNEKESLRDSIKGSELNSEKIELTLLEEEGRLLIARVRSAPSAAAANAALVVHFYRRSGLDETAEAAVDTVRCAFKAWQT